MLTPSTSLLIAEHDLRMLDEARDESPRTAALAGRRAHRTITALARLGHRMMALFL